jgi:hypothetical protein
MPWPRSGGCRQPRGGDAPHGRLGQGDALQAWAHERQGQAGEHGDAQPDGDEGLHRVVVVAAEDDPWLERVVQQVGALQRDSRPRRSPAISWSSCWAWSRRASTASACATRARPASVRPDRSDAAFDEPGGGLALASRHLLADRRRRERERLGRERAAAGDLPGELEPATPQGSGGR